MTEESSVQLSRIVDCRRRISHPICPRLGYQSAPEQFVDDSVLPDLRHGSLERNLFSMTFSARRGSRGARSMRIGPLRIGGKSFLVTRPGFHCSAATEFATYDVAPERRSCPSACFPP